MLEEQKKKFDNEISQDSIKLRVKNEPMPGEDVVFLPPHRQEHISSARLPEQENTLMNKYTKQHIVGQRGKLQSMGLDTPYSNQNVYISG